MCPCVSVITTRLYICECTRTSNFSCLFPMLHVFMHRHWDGHPDTQLCLGKCDSLLHHVVPESLLCSTPFFHFSLYLRTLSLNLPLSPASTILGIYVQSFKNNLRPSVLPCNMDLGFFCPARSLQRPFPCPACPPWCYTIYSPSPIAPSLDRPLTLVRCTSHGCQPLGRRNHRHSWQPSTWATLSFLRSCVLVKAMSWGGSLQVLLGTTLPNIPLRL